MRSWAIELFAFEAFDLETSGAKCLGAVEMALGAWQHVDSRRIGLLFKALRIMKTCSWLRLLILSTLTPALVACSADIPKVFAVQIENPLHQPVGSMRVRLTNEVANSCLKGDWKRLEIESFETKNASFFPFHDKLSYRIDGATFVIGRNEVCDSYLHLRGLLTMGAVQGEYISFGISGGKVLGYFNGHTAK
jgi:hypothetical protein